MGARECAERVGLLARRACLPVVSAGQPGVRLDRQAECPGADMQRVAHRRHEGAHDHLVPRGGNGLEGEHAEPEEEEVDRGDQGGRDVGRGPPQPAKLGPRLEHRTDRLAGVPADGWDRNQRDGMQVPLDRV